MSETKWFSYNQNNTGGSFRTEFGKDVLIEATDSDHADQRAEEIGLYFDGVDAGVDCDCCGDRWSRAWDEGYPVPSIYGVPLSEYKPYSTYFSKEWQDGKDIQIVPLEGPIEFVAAQNQDAAS